MKVSSTSDEERTACQAHKKKFAEDMDAAVQSSLASLRQIVEAKRADQETESRDRRNRVEN